MKGLLSDLLKCRSDNLRFLWSGADATAINKESFKNTNTHT